MLQDTRYALRTFRQKPGFTVVALLILALGIGATTVMFAVINSVLLRPLSYPEPDRLVTLRGFTEALGEFWGCSNLDFVDVKRESQTLALAAWTYGGGTISEPGEPEYVNGRQISAELVSILGISPVQGRAFRPDEDRPGAPAVAIISYGLWQRNFGGDASTIGRSLVYEGKPIRSGHELIGTGPYRYVRHPIYTGMLLALVGTVLILGEVRGLIGLGIAIVSFYLKARKEDAWLGREFGKKFEVHAKQTGMFLPRIVHS